jgi:predicted nucleic acid-binding protein
VSGNNLLLDTNIIVYALKGLANVKPYFDTEPFVSVITEMEVLGVTDISKTEINIRETAIEFCTIMPFTNKIKNRAIQLKKQIKIALPDAIIAATAIEEELTLVTADIGFKRIKDLQLILIEV